MKTKICTCCRQELSLDAFGKCSKNKDGLKELCRVCSSIKNKIYREKNRDKILLKHSEYRKEHHSELLQKHRIYHATHIEQEKAYSQKYKKEIVRQYCIIGQDEKIENYEKAKSENFKGWCRHHRLETHTSEGIRRNIDITPQELKALGMYYNRPASELIYMRNGEHTTLHKGMKND